MIDNNVWMHCTACGADSNRLGILGHFRGCPLLPKKHDMVIIDEMTPTQQQIPPFSNLYIGPPTKGKRLIQFWVSENDVGFWEDLI